jgi:hypothetical protein
MSMNQTRLRLLTIISLNSFIFVGRLFKKFLLHIMLSILELRYQIKRFDNEDFFLFFIK